MVSFVFGLRGVHTSVEQLKTDLMAQRFIWRRKDMKKDKWEDVPLGGMLRPIVLYEYVFPKTSPTIPGDMKSPLTDNVNDILYHMDLLGKDHYEPKYIGKYVKFAGKAMGLNPIPNTVPPQPGTPPRYFHLVGTSIIPIGIKDDEISVKDFKTAGRYYQENL